jgi:hypothetical protein
VVHGLFYLSSFSFGLRLDFSFGLRLDFSFGLRLDYTSHKNIIKGNSLIMFIAYG